MRVMVLLMMMATWLLLCESSDRMLSGTCSGSKIRDVSVYVFLDGVKEGRWDDILKDGLLMVDPTYLPWMHPLMDAIEMPVAAAASDWFLCHTGCGCACCFCRC